MDISPPWSCSRGLAVPAGAHTGDRVFPIPELIDEMLEEILLDDGSIDEWYDLVGGIKAALGME
ncbi:MAG: hypothetical protein OXH50_12920 [Gemmatimonadetes bacterium]|nr:hypothetical protein [Gemmatimonadota bacterium]